MRCRKPHINLSGDCLATAGSVSCHAHGVVDPIQLSPQQDPEKNRDYGQCQ